MHIGSEWSDIQRSDACSSSGSLGSVDEFHRDLGFLEFDEAIGVGRVGVLLGAAEPDATPVPVANLLDEL